MNNNLKNDINIYLEDMIKKHSSLLEVKKEMMKEYVFKLDEIIQSGAMFGDERIESIRVKWQSRFDILQERLEEERRDNAIDNMELLDDDEDYSSFTLGEITQNILDNNGVGSFSSF